MTPKKYSDKLTNLREWFTLPEAAERLSAQIEEQIQEKELLRWVLDGYLKLSVYFVNPVPAKRGKVVPIEDPKEKEISPEQAEIFDDGSSKITPWMIRNCNFDDSKFIPIEERITKIEGVLDLPLIGNERASVEQKFQDLTNGPEITSVTLAGTFVNKENNEIFQLQNRYLDYEIKILAEEFPVFKECHAEKLPYDHPHNYGTAYRLPESSVFVVRRQVLIELLGRFEKGIDKEFQINVPYLDKRHDFYAEGLKIAVEAWTELYERNPPRYKPTGGHKKYIISWLEKKYPELSQREQERIATLINPNRKGGASPIE